VRHVLKCFIKAEVYNGPKDPRNISTYNDRDKLTMAQFAVSLAGHLKKFKWYGPGQTPIEIARRVAYICENAEEEVNVSDYHRMDGTISYLLRKVDQVIFMKAFPSHKPVLNELFKHNAGNHGVLPKGTTFEQGSAHGSGCSATSVSQTLRAAFTAYLGFRNKFRAKPSQSGHRLSFDSLGIHLGDDGLDADLPIACHQWAAKRVGLLLEAGVVRRGFRGVNFLARFYSPEVWYGSINSMCDVKRQLGKLHTTTRMPDSITPETKLVEKAMGYVATDANTPVIGVFCRKAVETSPLEARRTELGIASWWSQFDPTVQFPNVNVDGWMDTEFSCQFPEFDVDTFNSWIGEVRTTSELLHAPLCAEPRPPKPGDIDVIVDGDVVPPAKPDAVSNPKSDTPAEKEEKRSGKQTRRSKRKPSESSPRGPPAKRESTPKSQSGLQRADAPASGGNTAARADKARQRSRRGKSPGRRDG